MHFDPLSYVVRLYVALFLAVVLYQIVVSILGALAHSVSGVMSGGAATGLGDGLGLGILVGIGVVVVRGAWQWYQDVRRRLPAPIGARWALFAELREEGFLGPYGWPIGVVRGGLLGLQRYVVRLNPLRERSGVAEVGTPGVGKSTCHAIPAIVDAGRRPPADRPSLIVVDPKNELARMTAACMERTHRVLIWDPSNPDDENAVTFEPFATLPPPDSDQFLHAVCTIADEWFAATLEGTPMSDPFWKSQPQSQLHALTAAYLALRHTAFTTFAADNRGASFTDFAAWVRGMTYERFCEYVEKSPLEEVRAYTGQVQALALSEKAVGSIWADLQQRFELCALPTIRRAMGRARPIDWKEFVQTPTVLYLRIAAADANGLQPLLSFFMARMFRALLHEAGEQPDNRLPREVRIIIDEFGNLPQILGFDKAVATLRSYGVGVYVLLQSFAQLQYHYGPHLAQVISDCLATKIVLGNAAQSDAEWASQRCGMRTVYDPTTSWSRGRWPWRPHVTRGYSPRTEPLISASEIIHMKGEAVMSTSGLQPVRAALHPWFRDPELRGLIVERPANRPPPGARPGGGSLPVLGREAEPLWPMEEQLDEESEG